MTNVNTRPIKPLNANFNKVLSSSIYPMFEWIRLVRGLSHNDDHCSLDSVAKMLMFNHVRTLTQPVLSTIATHYHQTCWVTQWRWLDIFPYLPIVCLCPSYITNTNLGIYITYNQLPLVYIQIGFNCCVLHNFSSSKLGALRLLVAIQLFCNVCTHVVFICSRTYQTKLCLLAPPEIGWNLY